MANGLTVSQDFACTGLSVTLTDFLVDRFRICSSLRLSRSSERLSHRFSGPASQFFWDFKGESMSGHEVKVGSAQFHLGAPPAHPRDAVPTLQMFAPASPFCRVIGHNF